MSSATELARNILVAYLQALLWRNIYENICFVRLIRVYALRSIRFVPTFKISCACAQQYPSFEVNSTFLKHFTFKGWELFRFGFYEIFITKLKIKIESLALDVKESMISRPANSAVILELKGFEAAKSVKVLIFTYISISINHIRD